MQVEPVSVSQAELARIRMSVSWALDTLEERSPKTYGTGDVLSLAMHYLGYALFTGKDDEVEHPTAEWRYAHAQLKFRSDQRRTPPVPSQYDVSASAAARISALADEIVSRDQVVQRMRHLRSISRGRARDI